MLKTPKHFVEPFAGGGIIGLTVAFERLADHVYLIELDTEVASVWQTILHGQAEFLKRRILQFEMSVANVQHALRIPTKTIRERAFRTLLKNRTQHGGILANGASFMNKGENGKGISSRWYPETLARRISEIARIRSQISFLNADGMNYMAMREPSDAVWFIDPPYTIAGRRLYTHHEIDHESLFRLVSHLNGDFLMTYDDSLEVRRWASKHSFDVHSVAMKSRQHYQKSELLIGRDLGWARRFDCPSPSLFESCLQKRLG